MFSSKVYLTKDQISGLFARFSKDQKLGKLVEPIRDSDQDEQEEPPVFANDRHHEIIIDAVNESVLLIKSHFELCVNDFVYLTYSSSSNKRKVNRNQHFVGQITTISEDDVEINLLEECENYFMWPDRVKKRCIKRNEIHVKLSCPSLDRRLHLLFPHYDLGAIPVMFIYVRPFMKGVENMSELNYSFLHLRSVSVSWSAARMCVSDC